MTDGFEWVVSPDVIAQGLEDYGQRAMVAIQAVANYWGQDIQNQARGDAPWDDRTTAARGGLFFAVDGFDMQQIIGEVTPEAKAEMRDVEIISGDAETLIITLGHTVFYGKYLELSNGGRFAVVMSTIENNLSGLERLVKSVFQG